MSALELLRVKLIKMTYSTYIWYANSHDFMESFKGIRGKKSVMESASIPGDARKIVT